MISSKEYKGLLRTFNYNPEAADYLSDIFIEHLDRIRIANRNYCKEAAYSLVYPHYTNEKIKLYENELQELCKEASVTVYFLPITKESLKFTEFYYHYYKGPEFPKRPINLTYFINL